MFCKFPLRSIPLLRRGLPVPRDVRRGRATGLRPPHLTTEDNAQWAVFQNRSESQKITRHHLIDFSIILDFSEISYFITNHSTLIEIHQNSRCLPVTSDETSLCFPVGFRHFPTQFRRIPTDSDEFRRIPMVSDGCRMFSWL